jgi:uncharacterized protein
VPAVLFPRSMAGLLDRSARGAVANARSALGAVTGAVADRRALTDDLGLDGAPEAPGGLLRLSRATCVELLAGRSVGRLAYVARAGTPDIVPVNYTWDGRRLLLRSGPGPKLQAAERGDVVAFEVDDLDEEQATGWSVVVLGTAARLTAAQEARVAEKHLPRPWARGPRNTLVAVTPRRVDGRRLG